MKRWPFTVTAKESRLIQAYESYVGRFVETLKDYDYKDPLQVGAAAVNVVTQFGGLDPLVRDTARTLNGKNEVIKPLSGILPRTRENTFGAVKNLFNGEILPAAAKVINIVGDGIADTADLVSGKIRP